MLLYSQFKHKKIKQIVDAALSNAEEVISVSSVIGEVNECTHSVRVQIANKETVVDRPEKLGHQQINNTEVLSQLKPEEHKQNEEKPTAIVKPKYQKSSFDDRQLPIIAYVNRDKPWYDTTDANTESNKNTKPQSNRKTKRNANKAAHQKSTGDLTTVRKDRGPKTAESSNKKSIVAVVQPIKMEKYNEPKVSRSKNEKNECNNTEKSDLILDKKQMPLEQKYLSGNLVLYFNCYNSVLSY